MTMPAPLPQSKTPTLVSTGVIIHDLEKEAECANERYRSTLEAVPELALSAVGYANAAIGKLETLALVAKSPDSYRPCEAGVPVLLVAASSAMQTLGEAVTAVTVALTMLAKLDLAQAALELTGIVVEDEPEPEDDGSAGSPTGQGAGGEGATDPGPRPGKTSPCEDSDPLPVPGWPGKSQHPENGPAVDLPAPPTLPVHAPGEAGSNPPQDRRRRSPDPRPELLLTIPRPDYDPPVNLPN